MALTVRLNARAERILTAASRKRRMSRSDVVREALEQYGARDAEGDVVESGPYAAWHDVIGAIELGVRDPSRTTGDRFAAIVRGQARGRRSR
jgi:Arc/MetJ-type ribon-helix-helix transcriptional regulator